MLYFHRVTRNHRSTTIALLALLVVSSFFAGAGLKRVQANDVPLSDFELFWEVLDKVKSRFIYNMPPTRKIVYGAIRGMLASLGDDYTRFMEPESYREMQIETTGEFGGIGIQIGIKENRLTVISPMEGTPAYKAGVKAGDWIVKVDGTTTKDMSLQEAVIKIRGKRGTKVILSIAREGEDELIDIPIVRDVIHVQAIEKKLVGDNLGYIHILLFNEDTGVELKEALDSLRRKGARGYLIDLRKNPGGLLTAAEDACSLFVERGKPVVQIEYGKEKRLQRILSTGTTPFSFPVVVLVDGLSASASEITTGCLQDYHIATVVGSQVKGSSIYGTGRTFGKGSVQTVYPLEDNSAVAITTARYLTAGGHDINKHGIEPDIIVELKKDQAEKWENPQLEEAKKILQKEIAKRM